MKRNPPVNPFDSNRYIGTVFEIGPNSAHVMLTESSVDAVEVGAFVVVDCGQLALFGRLNNVELPTQATPPGADDPPSYATAVIELLTTIGLDGEGALRGIERFPHLGSRVYQAPPKLVGWLFECNQVRETGESEYQPVLLNLMSLKDGTHVGLAPERVFGRHCAVVGATGVGKSWTLARLMEECAHYAAKMILFDSTGEFYTLNAGVRHVHIGTDPTGMETSDEVSMPYNALTESDLFALFKPSGPTQGPKLRAAMKSLKLARVPNLATGGVVLKAGKLKFPFEKAYAARAKEIEDPRALFDITKLPAQIDAECVFPTGGFSSNPDPTRWGAPNEIERSNCVSLITRIEDMLYAPELACVFQPGEMRVIFDEIGSFLTDDAIRILRISLKHLPFAHDAREVVANAVGRHLMELARKAKLGGRPLVVVLDEAHHFLNENLAQEDIGIPLDAFELIAKEGRKHWLNFCIATQRPRDIPEGILSQIGTFIVHRLNNEKDRAAVENASASADHTVLEFIPGLSEGQAVVIGADLPLPLAIQINKPTQEPDSRGPNYQKLWR